MSYVKRTLLLQKYLLRNKRNLESHKVSMHSCSSDSLIGGNFLKPSDLSTDKIKSVLWTASELKQFHINKITTHSMKDKHITLLMESPCVFTETMVRNAANLLNMELNLIIDPIWDNELYLADIGKYLSYNSEIILCETKYHLKIEELAEGSQVPVVNVKSSRYVVLDCLTHLMTLQEHYGSLKDLTLAWIGPPCPLINTYLCMATRFCMNISYFCACESGSLFSPALLPVALKHCVKTKSKIKECKTLIEAVHNADIISTASSNRNDLTITKKQVEGAKSNWTLLHPLKRTQCKIDNDICESKNNLTWEYCKNFSYVYAAVILRLVRNHNHIIRAPKFD